MGFALCYRYIHALTRHLFDWLIYVAPGAPWRAILAVPKVVVFTHVEQGMGHCPAIYVRPKLESHSIYVHSIYPTNNVQGTCSELIRVELTLQWSV